MTRELLTLNWEEVLDNFTFRYLCRFFSVHLLIMVCYAVANTPYLAT
ncbi:hypothetical protein [Dolichospermum circinale]|nr:hypothetical protein [Dolichospermum circinale]